MDDQKLNRKTKIKNLLHENATSEGAMKINDFINLLEKTSEKFISANGDARAQAKVISEFQKETENLRVLTMIMSGDRNWIQTPIKYYEETREFSLYERIFVYLKTKSKIPKKAVRLTLSYDKNVHYPLAFSVDKEYEEISKSNNLIKFFLTISFLKDKMIELKEKMGSELVAIYDKPYAIISMNNMKYYTENLIDRLRWGNYESPQSIEVKPLFDLITESKITNYSNTKVHYV